MATRRCPKCQLSNPGSAQTCDCGWSFVDQAYSLPPRDETPEEAARAVRRERHQHGTSLMLTGAAIFGVGLLITIATYASATGPSGGSYVIAYGPMLYGMIRFFRGASMRE